MKISLSENFFLELSEIVNFIANDKPNAAKKFKTELINAIKKDLQNPYNFKKSIYFIAEIYRDYVFKGYVITCLVNKSNEEVLVIGITKNRKFY
jgi:plasmid stabilization system protein ParE